jgi:hypothetical protein
MWTRAYPRGWIARRDREYGLGGAAAKIDRDSSRAKQDRRPYLKPGDAGVTPLGERDKRLETAPGAFALDKAGLFDLADIAIDAAKRAGADYVDIRLGETRREFLQAREDRL